MIAERRRLQREEEDGPAGELGEAGRWCGTVRLQKGAIVVECRKAEGKVAGVG